MQKQLAILSLLIFAFLCSAQRIPASYSNLQWGDDQRLYLKINGQLLPEQTKPTIYTIKHLAGNPFGSASGLQFDFNIPDFNGTLYYGFIHFQDGKFPQPVYFKRPTKIKNGQAEIDILNKMSGKYDMIGWQKKGFGTLGYRVADAKGNLLFEGIVSFKGKGPFEVIPTICEGPFVNLLTENSVNISFKTSGQTIAILTADSREFKDAQPTTYHEFTLSDLIPNQEYQYTIQVGPITQSYSFHTAPKAGTRKPFVFAYASDSRGGSGGGERNFYGPNYYMTKKIMALAAQKKVAFLQFTGDLISGYKNDKDEINLQYANWKKAIEPFAHYFPVMVGMGNHEALIYTFYDQKGNRYSIDRFPYVEYSAEAAFAENFVNPLNGPQSEDGAWYDPDPQNIDFPSYKENVYYYTYDNVAMVVLNSNYWYAPSLEHHPETSGNLHGYIMDQQLKWLKQTLQKLQSDDAIDHIFITEHTPFFPNGGHVGDDMWYRGSNKPRAVVNGQPVKKGIIERRDELLQIIVNETPKVAAILTGDEHNYCRTEIGPQTAIYPDDYQGPKIKLKRTIWQINNGAAGAPYYAQEKTPWSEKVRGFTTQNALVFFYVSGKQIKVKVYNPDTLGLVDEMTLR